MPVIFQRRARAHAAIIASPPPPEGIDPEEDWASRSGGPNVFYAENFSGFADTAELQNYEGISNPSRVSLTTEHALSGKTCRVTTLDTDGEVSNGMILSLNGRRITGQATPGDVYKRFYAQVIVWGDDYFNWPFRSTQTNAPKVFILDRCCAANGESYGPSANPGEVVIDHKGVRGFVTSYRRLTEAGNSFEAWDKSISTPANATNFQWQNAIDTGSALTDQNSYERRYGPMYDGMTGVNHADGIRLTTQHGANFPDPDAAQGGVAWNIGGYTVLEIFVDYDADKCLIWAAHYGDDPKLVFDSSLSDEGAAQFNNRSDIDGWSGFHLSSFRTAGIAEAGVRPTIVTDYPEVIISASPIPFPGDKLLPGALDRLIASLDEGAWGTLDTPSMTASVINNGSNDSIMSWARRGHFDSADNKAYFYGCTHNSGDPAFNFNYVIRYEAETHEWFKEAINDPEPFASNGIHGYFHWTLRHSDGHQFLRQRLSANIFDRSRGGAWGSTNVPNLPGSDFDPWNVADALEWYPDFGAAGALVFSCANAIYTWEPGDPSWTLRYSASNGGGNDTWIVYNRADSRIYTGVGTAMRRLDPDGTVVARLNPPFSCSVGTATPGMIFSSGQAANKMFAVNGSGSRAIHEYDHTANTWSGSIGTLPFDPESTGPLYLFFGITIPNQGVLFHYLTESPNPSPTMHVWRR